MEFWQEMPRPYLPPKFSNTKQEALGNEFATIQKYQWDSLLRDSIRILKDLNMWDRNIQYHWDEKKKKQMGRKLITLKDIMVIKLYTDYTDLQRAFRKSFVADLQNTHRISQFYHLYQDLPVAFKHFDEYNKKIILLMHINNLYHTHYIME